MTELTLRILSRRSIPPQPSLGRTCVFILLLAVAPSLALAQSASRSRAYAVSGNALRIDTVGLVSGSVHVLTYRSLQLIDTASYTVNAQTGWLYWKQKPAADSVLVRYTALPFSFYKTFRHKDYSQLNKTDSLVRSGFLYTPDTKRSDPLDLGGINYNGAFLRGLSFGNNQDVVLNSAFNLQMDGMLPGGIELTAALSDNNVPIQPEGNTQQLQEFDKVFIRLKKDKTALTVGDFEVAKPPGYFLNYNKKLQGARLQSDYGFTKALNGSSDFQVAVAKGKYAKNQFNGQEGNQGPYKLTGANGETFIIVLSGTEKVYLDGIPQQRGADLDYVVDYNTGEVTFTPKRLINSATRITVEFEYSDKNYFRTLLAGSQSVSVNDKLSFRVNVYNEQDNKNQPVQQDLDSLKRNVLAQAGDSLSHAVVPGVDSVGFDADKIRYKRVFDDVYGDIFTYSTNPDSAVYELTFSYVGVRKGNYVIANTSANGRVYKWVSPVNGSPQGNYAPYVQLVPPQLQQMLATRVEYAPDKQTALSVETAVSRHDRNTFSRKDKSDDDGVALMTSAERKFKLQHDEKNGTVFTAGLRYEYNQRTFTPVENFRPVEFERDWNIAGTNQSADLHQGTVDLQLRKPRVYYVQSQSSLLGRDTIYRGARQVLNGGYTKGRWNVASLNSVTFSQTTDNDVRFARPSVTAAYTVVPKWKINVGVKSQAEENKVTVRDADTLSAAAFRWYSYGAFLNRPDTSKFAPSAGYTRRFDEKPFQNAWHRAQYSDNVESSVDWRITDDQHVIASLNYRKLHAIDTLLIKQRSDESLASRLEHNGLFGKGLVNTSTIYELGSGLQQKLEYVYVQVPPGQGVFAYVGDYNGNGVKDLNEFEVAVFQDQAEYVKVFIPTNDYVKVFTTRLSHSLSLQPRAVWSKATGFKGFMARWSDVFSVQLDNKLTNLDLVGAANPFRFSVADSQLVTSQNLLSNVLSFNRTSPVYGVDGNWQRNGNKSLLSNGFESRQLTTYGVRFRWNLTRKITFQQNAQRDQKLNRSEDYANRNYNLEGYTLEPSVSYQFGKNTRLQTGYTYRESENQAGETNEQLANHKITLQFRTGAVGKSLLTVKADYAKVSYKGLANTPVQYAMLEGLQPGNNVLWNVTLDRKLSKVLEMSLSYDGRKTGTASAVHVGRVQARALF